MDDSLEILRLSTDMLGLKGGTTLRLMRKNGRILCAIPKNRKLALLTLGLYCPQRFMGKLAKKAVYNAIKLRMLTFTLPSKFITKDGAGTLSGCGILIGSPAHLIKRAIAVVPGGSAPEVAKLAFGEEGRVVLEKEANILQQLKGSNSGAPSLLGIESSDGVTIMRMPYDYGVTYTANTLQPVLQLLESWIKNLREPLKNFGEWSIVETELRRYGYQQADVERIAGLIVSRALRHGDFTRWNLRVGSNLALHVHDWERGCLDGVAGFDLAYFLIQDALLVKRLPPAQIVTYVTLVLKSPESSEYLRLCGWIGFERELILVICAFSNAAGYEDHSALLHFLSKDS